MQLQNFYHEKNFGCSSFRGKKWKCLSFSRSQLFATPLTVAHQAPLSMGILQARILEWAAIPISRGSSQPRDWTWVSCIEDRFFTSWATRAISQQFLTLILLLSLSSTFNDSCDYVVPISIFKVMYLLISNFISICRWNSPYHLMKLNHRIWGSVGGCGAGNFSAYYHKSYDLLFFFFNLTYSWSLHFNWRVWVPI